MLCSLAVIEKEKVKLNKKLEDMLKLWMWRAYIYDKRTIYRKIIKL